MAKQIPFDPSDTVALVTGASSGIGRAVAIRLAQAGMKVAVCARRSDRLETIRNEIGDHGDNLMVQTTDLRDEASIQALFAAVREKWGGVDVLVNNGGLGHQAPLISGSTEHWREMLDVNVLALCICTREAIADMRSRGDCGHVIHISSMSSHRVPNGSGMYSASKFAVRSLTEGLRQELREAKSQIRVTAISPGFVETEFAEKYTGSAQAAREAYGKYKVLQADDIANTVWYALTQPGHVQIHDMLIRPTEQLS